MASPEARGRMTAHDGMKRHQTRRRRRSGANVQVYLTAYLVALMTAKSEGMPIPMQKRRRLVVEAGEGQASRMIRVRAPRETSESLIDAHDGMRARDDALHRSSDLLGKPEKHVYVRKEEGSDALENLDKSFDALSEELQRKQDEYKQGKVDTLVSPNSFESHRSAGTGTHAGGSKLFNGSSYIAPYPTGNKGRRIFAPSDRILRFTSQKSPFHTSEVGALSTKQPATMSVGIFDPEYPFIPSGRRKLRDVDQRSRLRSNGRKVGNYSDMRAEKAPYESLYVVSKEIVDGNVLKKGWTRWMLDDDARLAVPDDSRRPRRDTAVQYAKKLVGKRWYRWKPGEGYVLSRYKDYSLYQNGPGIALGQLLPPREFAYTSPLPLIPNDSKRDFVWMIFWWIFTLSVVVIGMEIRAHYLRLRKGKRRGSRMSVPSLFVQDDEGTDSASSPVRTSSIEQQSIGLRTRQRTQARNFRDICKAALFPATEATHGDALFGGNGVSNGGPSSVWGTSGNGASSYTLGNARWTHSLVNGINGGPTGRSKSPMNGVLPMANEKKDPRKSERSKDSAEMLVSARMERSFSSGGGGGGGGNGGLTGVGGARSSLSSTLTTTNGSCADEGNTYLLK